MAGITHGMNIEEVEELGRYLSTRASREVESARQQVDRRISSVQWAGPESDRFRREVWPVRRDQLRSISEELRQFGDKVLEDARQQREASSAGAGAGPSGPPLVCKVAEGSDTAALADRMRNGEPGPQDLMLARMAAGKVPPGWEKLSDDQLRAAGLDPGLFTSRDGFAARLYRNEAGDVVLVFDGTDPKSGRDWGNNANQFLGRQSSQYDQALLLARSVKAVYGDELVIAGHSLGGGLASYAAVATDSPAVTFNPAAVSDQSLMRAGLDPDAARSSAVGLVRSFTVEGDILHDVQWAPSALGGPKILGTNTQIENGVPDLIEGPLRLAGGLVGAVGTGVPLHLMDAVVSSMERDPRFAEPGGGGGGGGSW